MEGIAPAFTQHVTTRWLGSVSVFQGRSEPRTSIYVSFRDDPYAGPGAVGEGQIIGYADIVPTPGLSMLKQPAMASSLTWTLELLTDDFGRAREGLWLMDTEVTAGRNGYLNQSATFWSGRRGSGVESAERGGVCLSYRDVRPGRGAISCAQAKRPWRVKHCL
jgi:hypothetical protein